MFGKSRQTKHTLLLDHGHIIVNGTFLFKTDFLGITFTRFCLGSFQVKKKLSLASNSEKHMYVLIVFTHLCKRLLQRKVFLI